MQTREALLAALIKIKDEINKQIPLAANNFEEYESAPQGADFDAVDEKYELHEKSFAIVRKEYLLYEYINELLAQFLLEQKVSDAKSLTSEQRQAAKECLIQSSSLLAKKMARFDRILKSHSSEDEVEEDETVLPFMDAYLKVNADQLIFQWQQTQRLTIANAEYAERLRLYNLLGDYREKCQQQFFFKQYKSYTLGSELAEQQVRKAGHFWSGVYFSRIQSVIGFCDEHTCIGLVKIFSKWELYYKSSIEKVIITYLDDDNKPDDGHTFLAINRDPASPLNEISLWGKDAILFDPWNKLVCFAEDLDKQPRHYFSYPSGAEWQTLKFDKDDNELLQQLTQMDAYYLVAGNEDKKTREVRLKEEFQLLSFEDPTLKETKSFIDKLVKEVWPTDLKMRVDFYLAAEGNELLTTLAGFEWPVIAIHKDFLTAMRGDIEVLRFALARELIFVKNYGAGICENLIADEEYALDKLVIEKTHDGEAAVRYLRWKIMFNRVKPEPMALHNLSRSFLIKSAKATPEQRIKTILALMAQQPTWVGTKEGHELPALLRNEACYVPIPFYTLIFSVIEGKLDKLRYLQSCLLELKIELLPYEHCVQPSVRVREFTRLLRELKLDLKNADEAQAVDDFINQAFKLRIPAFVELYYAILNLPVKTFYQSKILLPPLGIFKEYQLAIDAFVKAPLYVLAKSAATKLIKLHEQLKDHFVTGHISNPSYHHLSEYQKKHHAHPIGEQRFFGSWVGAAIAWRGFRKVTHAFIPWNQHLQWAKQDKQGEIQKILWLLGVHQDQALWDCFQPRALIDVFDNDMHGSVNPSISLAEDLTGGKVDDYHHEMRYKRRILSHLSARHVTQTKDFDQYTSFDEAYVNFFELNWPRLIAPNKDYSFNVDNDAIDFLLTQFTKAITQGSEEAKKMVKSFFLGREDERDLQGLCRYLKSHVTAGAVECNDHYANFVIEQQYGGKSFKFFTIEEQMRFLDGHLIICHYMPLLSVVKMLNLSYQELSFECLAEAIPLLTKQKMTLIWMLVVRMMEEHLETVGTYPVFNRKGAALIAFTEFAERIDCRTKMLQQFVWELPSSSNKFYGLSCRDLIKIYHAYAVNLIFPSMEIQQRFGQLILEKILKLTQIDERIKTLQAFVFNQTYYAMGIRDVKYYPAMNDIVLRNQLIELLVADLLKKYGKDDGSDTYKQVMQKVMDDIKKKASNRDLKRTLAQLIDAIEAQADLSEYAGVYTEPEKYILQTKKSEDKEKHTQLAILAAIATKLGQDPESQKKLIEFLCSPLTNENLNSFAEYLEQRDLTIAIINILSRDYASSSNRENIKLTLHSFYNQFWELKLQERAFVMDALLIPPNKVSRETEKLKAYQEGLSYVTAKLFPNAKTDEDENFALAFIQSYLEVANHYTRPYLMAGLLVSANETQSGKASVGRKLALFCESLGPAYVKLAQAIHSHPKTPEAIRRDLDHIKGRANPPYRWDLWLLIDNVLPDDERAKIKRIGKLIGSASYNLALEAQLINGDDVVLLLLRENAEKEAKEGFAHLKKTMLACDHPRMVAMRDAGISILEEAEKLSVVEMDHELSAKQAKIASIVYPVQTSAKINERLYTIDMLPAAFVSYGKGYRFLQRMYGIEFNDLPVITSLESEVKKKIAYEVLVAELINIFSGSYFDSDRHGNQMRVLIDHQHGSIALGLYDFGEMALEKPSDEEIDLLIKVIKNIPPAVQKTHAFDQAVDEVISSQVDRAIKKQLSVAYLMRVRKAILALQDFQRELNNEEVLSGLKKVCQSDRLNADLKKELKKCVKQLEMMKKVKEISSVVSGLFSRRRVASTESNTEFKPGNQ